MTHSPTCSGCSYCNPEEFGMFRGCSDDDSPAPDSYSAGLASPRAAAASPATTFEDAWKTERLRELAAEHAEHDARIAASPGPRLTAAQLAEFEPPDPYRGDLKALRSKENQ